MLSARLLGGGGGRSKADPQRLDLNKRHPAKEQLTHWERVTLDASLFLKSDGASPLGQFRK